jgi:hypothetical protein
MAMTSSQDNIWKNTPAANRAAAPARTSQGSNPLPDPGRVETSEPFRPKKELDAPGMLSINFLPNEYRERGAVRKKTLWQTVVLVLFGSVVAATIVFQLDQRRAAKARVTAVAGPYAFAQARAQKLEHLQKQLRLKRQTADLLVYLQHPWPRTQILTAAAAPLPASVRLEELQVARETPILDGPSLTEETRPRRSGRQQEEGIPSKPAPVRDQELLRKENDSLVVVVRLTGITRNTADLHAYLAEVIRSPLIAEAELSSLERIEDESEDGKSRFAVRLKVAPGFGQPGGPDGPVTDNAHVAAALPEHQEDAG